MARKPRGAAFAAMDSLDAADAFVADAPKPSAGAPAETDKLVRVSVQVTPEMHRRIKLALADRGLSLRDWFHEIAEKDLAP